MVREGPGYTAPTYLQHLMLFLCDSFVPLAHKHLVVDTVDTRWRGYIPEPGVAS